MSTPTPLPTQPPTRTPDEWLDRLVKLCAIEDNIESRGEGPNRYWAARDEAFSGAFPPPTPAPTPNGCNGGQS